MCLACAEAPTHTRAGKGDPHRRESVEKGIIQSRSVGTDGEQLLLSELHRVGVDWSFSVHDLVDATGVRPLFPIAYYLFIEFDVQRLYGVGDEVLRNLIMAVERGYRHVNPYHNAYHAADVLHSTCCFLCDPDATQVGSGKRGARHAAAKGGDGADAAARPLFPLITNLKVLRDVRRHVPRRGSSWCVQ